MLNGAPMSIDSYGARLTRRDIAELDNASNALAAVAGSIQRANPVWKDAAIQNLILANNTVVRLQAKGQAAIDKEIARRAAKSAAKPSEVIAAPNHTASTPIAVPGEEER